MMPNGLHFCCGDGPRPQSTDGCRPRASAGRPRQQQVRVRQKPEAGGPHMSRAAIQPMLGEGGPATHQELHLSTLILAVSRSSGKEGRAGPTERSRDPDDWDAGPADGLERQPPGASLRRANMALAPGGGELPRWPWVPSSGPPPISGGPPADAGSPNTEASPSSGSSSSEQFKHQSSCGEGEMGFCLTSCASAAGACGAAARPSAEHNRAAAPRTRPGQQQARVRPRGGIVRVHR